MCGNLSSFDAADKPIGGMKVNRYGHVTYCNLVAMTVKYGSASEVPRPFG